MPNQLLRTINMPENPTVMHSETSAGTMQLLLLLVRVLTSPLKGVTSWFNILWM